MKLQTETQRAEEQSSAYSPTSVSASPTAEADLAPEALTAEKSLYDVWRASRMLKDSAFNSRVTFATGLLLILYAITTPITTALLAAQVRNWADAGQAFVTGILGFLVAGFTIFATLTKPALFVRMAKVRQTSSGLSYLKYNFAHFIRVFVHYLIFFGSTLVMKLFGFTDGPLSLAIGAVFRSHAPEAKRFLAALALVGVGTYFTYLVLILQSFVFNVYHVVMTSIRWEMEGHESDAR